VETVALILSCVGTAAGATWVLAMKLGKIESAIKDHVIDDTSKFVKLDARVVKLEKRRK
jgi:hypothetical protein